MAAAFVRLQIACTLAIRSPSDIRPNGARRFGVSATVCAKRVHGARSRQMALPFASSSDSPHAPTFARGVRSPFAAASMAAFLLLPACSDPYTAIVGNCHDPSPDRSTARTCDGNSLVETQYRNGNNHAQCEANEVSRKACGQASACLAWPDAGASCATVCGSNSDCPSTQYCDDDASLDGRRACFNFVPEHASCVAATTHCAPGTSCRPQYRVSDAGADAAHDAALDADTEDADPPFAIGYTCDKP